MTKKDFTKGKHGIKEVKYLPAAIDEGYVLLVSPNPGDHSFKVVFTHKNGDRHEYDTELIKLY